MTIKEKFKELSRNTKRFIAVGVTLVGISGTIAGLEYLAKPAEYKTASETYRGYHNNRDDGLISRNYVFDSLLQGGRGNRPVQYSLEGYPDLAYNILAKDSIGKKYRFVYGKPRNPLIGPQLYSVERDTSNQ